jgi:predicted glycosyltransferase
MSPSNLHQASDSTGRYEISRGRVLFYSHDTYGLGHIRRTLCLVSALLDEEPAADVMLASGSPVIDRLAIPAGVRVLPLKPVVKTGAETYEARDGSMDRRQVIAHRSWQLVGAVAFFRPDVLVVDHAPLGMKGELVPALNLLRGKLPWARTVLGLRDILDEPEVVRRTWREQHVYEALEHYYDRIMVYGERRHFPVDREYALPAAVCSKLQFTGYIRKRDPLVAADVVRDRLGIPPKAPFLLATVGGGGDGAEVLSTAIAAVAQIRRERPALRALIVTGPLMDERTQQALFAAGSQVPGLKVAAFMPDPTSVMAAADVLVGMAGYNTVTEVLALGCRAVLVPRVVPRREQWIRARLLQRHGLAQMLEPSHLTPENLARAVERSLCERRYPPTEAIALDGTEHAVAAIRSLMRDSRRAPGSIPEQAAGPMRPRAASTGR